jgi:glutamate-1-semialdehyde 2,1-aminomutase
MHFAGADRYIPGGVNTTLRRTKPSFMFVATEGAYMWTNDGRRLCDYHGAFGAIILGHRYPVVDAAVRAAMDRVDLVGSGVTDLEVRAAETIVQWVPSADKVWFANSGAEVTYIAIRLARAVTGKRRVVKFQGSYHGWHDAVLMNVATPAEKLGQRDPMSQGALSEVMSLTAVCRYNCVDAVRQELAKGDVAAVIVEPVQHNIGSIEAEPDFLRGLRRLTSRYGAVLIFDEVITAVRHGLGGWQDTVGVHPDLTCLGKAIGNGYPVAALAGRADLMDELSTAGGGVYVGGTYNGHPMSMAALCATFDELADGEIYSHMRRLGDQIRDGLRSIAAGVNWPLTVAGIGSVFCVYFVETLPRCYEELAEHDRDLCLAFRQRLIDRGDLLHPLPLKRGSISASHTDADISRFLEHAGEIIPRLTEAKKLEGRDACRE